MQALATRAAMEYDDGRLHDSPRASRFNEPFAVGGHSSECRVSTYRRRLFLFGGAMKAHRLAEYFPMLEGDEFNLLVEDIRKNGQLEPIVTVDGLILDGVNRYRACQELGIEPNMEEYIGNDPLSYVVSLNVRRRHMDTSQRAMLATEMLPEFEANAAAKKVETAKAQRPDGSAAFVSTTSTEAVQPHGPGVSSVKAAGVFGVKRATIERAKRVKEQAPEKVADIIAGRMSVRAVDTELREKAADKRHAERVERGEEKSVKARPKVVADYMAQTMVFKHAVKLAIMSAQRAGMFSAPETKQFMKTRHDELRSWMAELENV